MRTTFVEGVDDVSEDTQNYRVALLHESYEKFLLFSQLNPDTYSFEYFTQADQLLSALRDGISVDAIVAGANKHGWELLAAVKSNSEFSTIPLILLTERLHPSLLQRARDGRADDIFEDGCDANQLEQRLHFLLKRKKYLANQAARKVQPYYVEVPLWKRAIDVALVGSTLLVLLPVLLLVALVIRLDSRGGVFYKSKRVGSGYRIFDLYKFRTMRTDADQLIRQMAALNMYDKGAAAEESTSLLCSECQSKNLLSCERVLFWDGKEVCEKEHIREKEGKAAFMKFQNDPRVTRVGQFLRNTSLDELPQLVNILKGDMSLVGNRPLPLYEAEKLTTDDKILRFAGPAGLTGYWQVMKRGKGKDEISEAERIEMDIYYVKNFSFLLDMKIILKTFPALLQSESV